MPLPSFRRSPLPVLLLLLAAADLLAQRGPVYPTVLYNGPNILTIRNRRGIDRITTRQTGNVRVTRPTIRGCPTEIDLNVEVLDPTTEEQIELTIYDCDGGFTTEIVRAENWDILHERTGIVLVGRDTCIRAEIRTTTPKVVDSMAVDDPSITLRTPPGGPPWRAEGVGDFRYDICFRPTRAGVVDERIRLYIRRSQPNRGLTTYMIEKPITAVGANPPPPPEPTRRDTLRALEAALPPLTDPTTFRHIVIPTAETLGKRDFFLGSYDLVGILAGYGITDRLTVIGGGSALPASIMELFVATIGARYQVYSSGDVMAAAGFQLATTSTSESDISLAAPYAVVSYGDRRNRLSLAAGYAFKRHELVDQAFDRNAAILALGGDVTIARGWKIAAETYVIESSGLVPVSLTARWFSNSFALDVGFAVDLKGDAEVTTSGLSGEIRNLRIAPLLSVFWRW